MIPAGMGGATAVVLLLVLAVIGGPAAIIVTLLRWSRRSPEQREAGTHELVAVTEGAAGYLQTVLSRLNALEAADREKSERIAALETSDREKDARISDLGAINRKLHRRVAQLIAFIGHLRDEHGNPVIPPDEDAD